MNSKEYINKMGNIGIGLSSNKKKTKLVTLTTLHTANSKSNKGRSSSKSRNFHETVSISRDYNNYNSRSISKSHKSGLNSRYSTNLINDGT